MTHDEAKALLEKTASELGEHFESVRIIATWPTEDDSSKTSMNSAGSGNFYAQYGSIVTWLETADEATRHWERKQSDADED